MSDYDQPNSVRPQTNTAGLVGFIISLVSLVGCSGLLSPVSLIFSIVGLTKQPKGFAIAGLVLSLLGMLTFVLIFFVIGVAAVLSLVGLGMAAALIAIVAAVGQNAVTIVDGVHDHYEAAGVIPASLDELGLEAHELTDVWGNDFVYVRGSDNESFLLISAGPDGVIASSDDYIGEIDFSGSGFDAQLHRDYNDLNPVRWIGLPQPGITSNAPELPGSTAQPTDDAP